MSIRLTEQEKIIARDRQDIFEAYDAIEDSLLLVVGSVEFVEMMRQGEQLCAIEAYVASKWRLN
jgi:hypothetical protein